VTQRSRDASVVGAQSPAQARGTRTAATRRSRASPSVSCLDPKADGVSSVDDRPEGRPQTQLSRNASVAGGQPPTQARATRDRCDPKAAMRARGYRGPEGLQQPKGRADQPASRMCASSGSVTRGAVLSASPRPILS
jgi:hypothetical protein